MTSKMIHQPTGTLRTFVAVPLSQELVSELDHLQHQLKRHCPAGSVRWVNPTNIHLTLRFLGDILPERADQVREALDVVARNVTPRSRDAQITFRVEGIGAFPNLSRARVIWVGVKDPEGGVSRLYETVSEALSSVGFTPEERGLSPHLTIGRITRQASASDVKALGKLIAEAETGKLGSVAVEEMIFFQSVLKPSGAVYTPLHTFSLTAEG
jgi:RNA 2',3'-cyclic 3'-phosphodiesterase